MTTTLDQHSVGAKTLEFLQKLGSSLMLPIAILPVAGLLLRLGAGDLLDWPFMFKAGEAVFKNLALIFAIGVAVGWAKESHGAAALSAFIAFVVMNAAAPEIATLLWDKAEGTDMSVLGGILVGLLAGGLYNRFYRIVLPDYLAFFGGRRFVPIITGLVALVMAFFVALIWPFVGELFSMFGNWIVASGSVGLFFYGVFNRLLIVTGLHHILNNLVWFQFGEFTNAAGEIVKGDLWRFFAGDPSAGGFMSGYFPIMMFGLPAAALAMYTTAFAKNKKRAAGILFSAALTAFLTGVTEPLEFAFMFLAPVLYGIHAVLTGISLVVMNLLGVKLGFTFSAGLFDYILSWGISSKPYMLLVVGPVYAVVYYVLFVVFIRWMNIPTVGREPDHQATESSEVQDSEKVTQYIEALGSAANILEIKSCATRLRLIVANSSLVEEDDLTRLGARGVLKPTANSVQVIVGTEAEFLADAMKQLWKEQGGVEGKADLLTDPKKDKTLEPSKADARTAKNILSAFEKKTIHRVHAAAGTRLVIELKAEENSKTVKTETLEKLSLPYVQQGKTFMITAGERAQLIAQVINDLLL